MFEIRFQGFMTFARVADSTNQEHQRVVIYDVPSFPHVPLITLRTSDIVSVPSEKHQTGPGAECYYLRTYAGNALVGITTDLPANSLPTANLIGVPKLTAISNGQDPIDEIRTFTPTNAVPVMIEIPEGTISVHNWFPDVAQFGTTGPAACVPRTTTFSTTATSNVTLTLDNAGRKFVLKPDSLVYISNAPYEPESDSDPHFGVMAAFFKNSVGGGAVFVKEPRAYGPCTLGTADDKSVSCLKGSTLSVECSHTQFP